MEAKIVSISEGTVTSPKGFRAGATYAGIKKAKNGLDLGILYSETPCAMAGVFTRNRIKAAPVVLSQERLLAGRGVAVVVNSGCANACTGESGLRDATEMAALAAGRIGVAAEDVLVASTGVIGQRLPMDRIRIGMGQIVPSGDGGHTLVRAMMTTDTYPKEVAVRVDDGGYTIGGVVKGSGMVHPDMGTMLCFLTTDAAVERGLLQSALRKAVDLSFNMVSVDGDTSTNDTVLIMANGLAGNRSITRGSRQARIFQQALDQVCIHLARSIASDGEGASKLIQVTVNGAPGLRQARSVAQTIVNSPLVKTAVYGNDPNWGRIIAAAGRSGVPVEESKIDLTIGGVGVLKGGKLLPFEERDLVAILKKSEIAITLDLNLGRAQATAWGCDLTEKYVAINSQYMT